MSASHPVRSRLRAMATAELSRRVDKVVGYPPLSELGDLQRREFHEALLDADSFEDLPGRWEVAGGDRGGGAEPARAARRDWRLARSPVKPGGGASSSGAPSSHFFRAVWVFAVARNLERRHTRSDGPLSADHRERSSCVGDVYGSRPTLARRGLRASVAVGRGGCPGRGHLRDAGVPRLPTSRPGVSPVSDRSLRAPIPAALPTRGSLRRLRPGTRVLGMACCKSHALQARNSPAVAA
jgi:hypothetical protein